MNNTEHLLTCLAEECGEVAKEVSKALRFGLENKVTMDPKGPRGTEGPTNAQKIEAEMVDLLAVWGMLMNDGTLAKLDITIGTSLHAKIERKQAKVRAYMEYARSVGSLENDQAETRPSASNESPNPELPNSMSESNDEITGSKASISGVLLGFDGGSPEGDRSVVTITMPPEKFAAMRRAEVPPGDPEGDEVLRQIEAVKNAVLSVSPRCEIRVMILQPNL